MKWISVPQSSQGIDTSPMHGGDDLLVLLAIGLLVFVMALGALKSYRDGQARRGSWRRKSWTPRTAPRTTQKSSVVSVPFGTSAARSPSTVAKPASTSGSHQLDAVAGTQFRKQKLLNGPEYRLFCQLEDLLPGIAPGHRLMAQTSMAELVLPAGNREDPAWKKAFNAINAKRLDFAIIDPAGYLACAIEYQGSGHYIDADTTFMRDAVKREALRRAGVPLIEIDSNFEKEDVEASLRRHFRAATAAS